MFRYISNRLKYNKKLVENISYLTLLQVFTAATPIITYPYLLRVLGGEIYGTVIYVQVIMSYFSLLIDGGFKNSAAKDISIHRDNKEKISEIISSVLTVRIILWLILLGLLIIAIIFFPVFGKLKYLYLFSFGYTLNELLLPQFYFLGTERMKYMTILNVVVKSVFVLLMFFLIKDQSDYLMVPLLYTFGFLIGGVIGLYIIFIHDGIKLKAQSFSTIKRYIYDSFPLLATTLVASIKDKFNYILIGNYLGMSDVVVYDLGMKLVALLNKPIEIINTALFPKITKERNVSFVRILIKYSSIIMVVFVLLIQIPLESIVSFLSDNTVSNVSPIRILLIVPILMTASVALATNYIIAFGHYKALFKVMLSTTLFYVFLVGLGIVYGVIQNLMIFVSIIVITYFVEMILRINVSLKLRKIEGHN